MAGYKGKQGSKPIPTALKLLRGNPGRRPLNDREPKAAPKLPSPPAELSDAAKKEWWRTGRKLLAAGIVTELDASAFAAYCQSYARWLEAQAVLAKTAMLVKNKQGFLMANPLLRVARDAQEQFTKILSEFGMTPSSRSRVHANAPKDADPFEAFLNHGGLCNN